MTAAAAWFASKSFHSISHDVPAPLLKDAAHGLMPAGITYGGWQEGFGEMRGVHLFTDHGKTGTTFAVHAGETLADALLRTRAAFAMSA